MSDLLRKVWYDKWEAIVRIDRKEEFPDTIPGAIMDAHKLLPKRTLLRFFPENVPPVISQKSGLMCFRTKYSLHRLSTDSSGIPVIHRISKVHYGMDSETGIYAVGLTTQSWRFGPIGHICMLWEGFKREKKLNKLRIMDGTGNPINIGTSLAHFKKAMANAAVFEVPYSFAEKFIAETGGRFAHDPSAKSLKGLFYLQPTLYIQFAGDRLGIQMYPPGFHDKYSELSTEDRQLVLASRQLFIDEEMIKYFKRVTYEVQYTHRMIDCIGCCYREGSQCKFMVNGKCPSFYCCCMRECPYREDAFDEVLVEWQKIIAILVKNPSVNSGIEKINDVFNDEKVTTLETAREGLFEAFGKVLIGDLLDYIRPVYSIEELQVEFISAYFRKAALVAFEQFTDKWQNRIRQNIFPEWRTCIILGHDSDKFMRDIKVQYCRAMAFVRIRHIYNKTADAWDRKVGNPPKHRVDITENERVGSFLKAAKPPKKKKKPGNKKKK
jgi:hypothetical protein